MRHRIATFCVAAALCLGTSAVYAGDIEKEPLNLDEITQLVVQDQVDRAQIEDTEAGMKSGTGLLILAIIGIAILVAN